MLDLSRNLLTIFPADVSNLVNLQVCFHLFLFGNEKNEYTLIFPLLTTTLLANPFHKETEPPIQCTLRQWHSVGSSCWFEKTAVAGPFKQQVKDNST